MAPEEQRRLLLPDAYHTGRLTHQFLALYFYGRYCAYGLIAHQARALMPRLAERIAQEAALDFRVTDLYLQRIVCLLLAGRADLVRPRLVERVLAAQQINGGWKYSGTGGIPGSSGSALSPRSPPAPTPPRRGCGSSH